MERKVQENISKAKNIVRLEVGGKIFSTSKSTLIKFEGSYFSAMLGNGNWQPEENGVYFIDRNPKYFGTILDYMRYETIDLEDWSNKDLSLLKIELDYYQIPLPLAFDVMWDELKCNLMIFLFKGKR